MGHTSTPSQEDINAFVGAAHADFDTVRAMLHANPNLLNCSASWQETAVQAAAQTGQVLIAEFLLEKGAPLDICTAAMLGMKDRVITFLAGDQTLALSSGAHGIPAVYFAVIRGHLEIANLLLEAGADLDAGEGGTTALHGAVIFDQPAVVDWLLTHGVKPDPKNYESKTPLDLALAAGNERVASRLKNESNPGKV